MQLLGATSSAKHLRNRPNGRSTRRGPPLAAPSSAQGCNMAGCGALRRSGPVLSQTFQTGRRPRAAQQVRLWAHVLERTGPVKTGPPHLNGCSSHNRCGVIGDRFLGQNWGTAAPAVDGKQREGGLCGRVRVRLHQWGNSRGLSCWLAAAAAGLILVPVLTWRVTQQMRARAAMGGLRPRDGRGAVPRRPGPAQPRRRQTGRGGEAGGEGCRGAGGRARGNGGAICRPKAHHAPPKPARPAARTKG